MVLLSTLPNFHHSFCGQKWCTPLLFWKNFILTLFYKKRHDNQVGAILNEPINLLQCTQNKSIVRTTRWWQKSLAPQYTWKSMLDVRLIPPLSHSTHKDVRLIPPLGHSTHKDVWLHYGGAAALVILTVPDISNIFWTIGLTVVHQRVIYQYHGHQIVMMLQNQTAVCGELCRDEAVHRYCNNN